MSGNATEFAAAARELWEAGELRWLLDPHQQRIYDWWWGNSHRVVCWNFSRRWGKTSKEFVIGSEVAIRKPDARIRLIAPTQKAIDEILTDIVPPLLESCPNDLRPQWHAKEGCFEWPNGSLMYVGGAEDLLKARRQRGRRSDLVIVDEASSIPVLDYLVKSIVLPQTLGRYGLPPGRVIIASTPDDTAAAPFKALCNEAELRGAYLKLTIDDNEAISQAEKESMIEALGGREAVACRRELFCEFILDDRRAVVPEWKAEYIAPPPPQRPWAWEHLHRYVAMDIGGEDFTAVLFGYYDFAQAKLIIERELHWERNEALTNLIAADIGRAEFELWGKQPVFRRIADNNAIIFLQDLATTYGLSFAPTSKDELVAMVNELRIFVRAGRLQVAPECKYLIGCLENGIWNQRHDKFERIPGFGHVDHLAALIYLIRNLDQQTNPIPATYGMNPGSTVVRLPLQRSESERALERVFGGRRHG